MEIKQGAIDTNHSAALGWLAADEVQSSISNGLDELGRIRRQPWEEVLRTKFTTLSVSSFAASSCM
jgi:hypothetical protein